MTKLHPPRLLFNPMPRKEHCWETVSNHRCKVFAVTAPAGYGKSTLLSQWHDEIDNGSFAKVWFNIDAHDNDPVRLIRYLITALESATNITFKTTLDQLKTNGFAIDLLIDCLLSDLSQLDKKTILFIDDLHLITNEICLTLFTQLIFKSPSHLVFVLASRQYLPYHLSQLKVTESLYHIDMNSLSFSSSEINCYINDYKKLNLSSNEIDLLASTTEGWAVGLQLITLVLENYSDKKAFLNQLLSMDKDIAQYLEETVFSTLVKDLQDFILTVALFDRFCADLFQAITGRHDGHALIAQLEKMNLFIISLDY